MKRKNEKANGKTSFIRIPKAAHQRLKIEAAKHNLSIPDMAAEIVWCGIKNYISANRYSQ